jgi:hypothetical protein
MKKRNNISIGNINGILQQKVSDKLWDLFTKQVKNQSKKSK